jgi:hypothetical protein
MADEHKEQDSSPVSFVDEEFAGKHGNTASESSLEEEQNPDFHPQRPTEVAEKLTGEAAEEPGVGGKAKKVLQELDRQVGGEYERREDPGSVGPHGEPGEQT